jgi:hypothetical protein
MSPSHLKQFKTVAVPAFMESLNCIVHVRSSVQYFSEHGSGLEALLFNLLPAQACERAKDTINCNVRQSNHLVEAISQSRSHCCELPCSTPVILRSVQD